MSRINTNVSSLVAQNTLSRNNNDLQQALGRLSTGLRINSGADDPAGLIASENLRRDITAVNRAIQNSERAGQAIATADSALGQVSSLLNNIRGLVTESANSGALSDEQIAANQLQIDSSLEAIDRIAQVTTFQGRRLLDGSLDFIVGAGTNYSQITNLQIDQATIDANGIDVDINVTTAATQASIATSVGGAVAPVAASAALDFSTTGGAGGFTITAATTGTDYHGITVSLVQDAAVSAGSAIATFDETNSTLTLRVNGNTANATIAAAVTAEGTFTAGAAGGTSGAGAAALATTTGGIDASSGLIADVVFELRGSSGSEVFNFQAGTSADQIVAAINLSSDATGVSAVNAAGTVTISSADYGSKSFVEVNVISEGAGGTFESGFGGTLRGAGADIVARVNGVEAKGNGNELSINTSTLDLTASITAGFTGAIDFDIDGGGALFQLGPKIVTNQQARIGIGSVNTGSLGGNAGRLYQLRSGQNAALGTSTTLAASIVDEVITDVVNLRGRLGAFQQTTLQSNIVSLSDTLVNLTAAESSIRDADFAKESAALTRAQILVQSGTSVLAIANQNPQNVLALLR